MKSCTFFGHRDCTCDIKTDLMRELEKLIEDEGVERFYVGKSGGFDRLVRECLRELKVKYPHIRYYVVLEKMLLKADEEDYSDTIFPDELADVHPKFAIDHRNRWMLNGADFVVTFVKRNYGGAAKFSKLARNKGKKVINIEGAEEFN